MQQASPVRPAILRRVPSPLGAAPTQVFQPNATWADERHLVICLGRFAYWVDRFRYAHRMYQMFPYNERGAPFRSCRDLQEVQELSRQLPPARFMQGGMDLVVSSQAMWRVLNHVSQSIKKHRVLSNTRPAEWEWAVLGFFCVEYELAELDNPHVVYRALADHQLPKIWIPDRHVPHLWPEGATRQVPLTTAWLLHFQRQTVRHAALYNRVEDPLSLLAHFCEERRMARRRQRWAEAERDWAQVPPPVRQKAGIARARVLGWEFLSPALHDQLAYQEFLAERTYEPEEAPPNWELLDVALWPLIAPPRACFEALERSRQPELAPWRSELQRLRQLSETLWQDPRAVLRALLEDMRRRVLPEKLHLHNGQTLQGARLLADWKALIALLQDWQDSPLNGFK